MTTRHLIDPELLPLLEIMPAVDFNAETLPFIRQMSESRFNIMGEPAMTPETRVIDGPAGPLEVLWYDPAPGTQARAALLHVHGGGMIIGSARSMQHGPAAMAKALGIPIASVEYRLAPENPFPAPQEDCLAALAWLAGNAAELGIDTAPMPTTRRARGSSHRRTRRRRVSATTASSLRNSSRSPATSKSRSWPTSMATAST